MDCCNNEEIGTTHLTLFRAVGPGQLRAIMGLGWSAFPRRLSSQKFFYPQLHVEFARRTARNWNVDNSGVGFVLRFVVNKRFFERYSVYSLGDALYREYRIPATQLEEMNNNIVGSIELLDQFTKCPDQLNRKPELMTVAGFY